MALYDAEMGVTYLQSRYYSPEWGRFLNADVYVDTEQGMFSCDMYAYCENDPVNRIDTAGESYKITVNSNGSFSVSGSFTLPTWNPSFWNSSTYVGKANCYLYAINAMTTIVDKSYMQPGIISGKHFSNRTESTYIAKVAYAFLADMKALGVKVSSISTLATSMPSSNSYAIALVADANDGDYHWYRADGGGKSNWSHKRGLYPATQLDRSGKTISDPQKANRCYPECNYSKWWGYFYLYK